MTSKPPSPTTQLVAHDYVPPTGFDSPAVPVHKASTVFFANVAAMRAQGWLDRSGYTYGLHGTPTTFTLEQRLCTLEGAKHCVLAPSGLAAVTLVGCALLSSGDHVVLPTNVYTPNLTFTRHELKRWGVTHTGYHAMDVASLQAALQPNTKVVWLEAAGSITLEFPDLRALVRCVRERAPHAKIVLDNTWGAGIAFNPYELGARDGEALGVDACVHALTKYPSGGGDVLMGSVTCRDDALFEVLAMTHSRLGLGVGANDVELVLRGLPTAHLRYAHHDASTRRLAQWLTTQRAFARVLHPALPDSPGHQAWAELCDGAACLVSVQFAPEVPLSKADAFVDALKRFHIGYSWAGPMSLAVPYDLSVSQPQDATKRGPLVRLSIGLEDPQDLIDDIEQALRAVRL
jgi:cysteine-S-conjugate beta-lyase